jgi:hypothetical protein
VGEDAADLGGTDGGQSLADHHLARRARPARRGTAFSVPTAGPIGLTSGEDRRDHPLPERGRFSIALGFRPAVPG